MHMQQQQADPASEHVAGKAAVNVVTAAQFAEFQPASEVGRWAQARSSREAAPVAAPKAVVQFSMADEVSRRNARGEIDPAVWKALELEREGRKEAMVAELVGALGEAAREQTKKHVNALMAFQFSRVMRPRELARLKPAEGSLGGAVPARSISVEGAAALMGEVMEAGFPEFDWTPVGKLAHMVGRLLQLQGPAAMRRASEIYDWGLKQMQTAGRVARDDTSGTSLVLLDNKAFARELQQRVERVLEAHDQHQADMDEVRAQAGGTPPGKAGRAGGEGGAGGGGMAGGGAETGVRTGGALGRAVGVADMSQEKLVELRVSFDSEYAGKCLYMSLLGTCNPTGGKACPKSHAGLPSKVQMTAWASKLGYTC